jgi:putative ABC transport system substrate-binding protein
MSMRQAACVAALAGLAAIGWCAGEPHAQENPQVLRVGILSSGTRELRSGFEESLLQGLRDQGYVEGKNLVVERRYGASRIKENAGELASMHLDAVVTTCTPSTRVMKDTTSSTAIVMAAVSDPVRQGIIASLAKPGQNVTGTSSQAEDLLVKRLQHVAALMPKSTIVAVLTNANNPVHALGWETLSAAAAASGIVLRKIEIKVGDDLDAAFEAAAQAKAGALFLMPDDPLLMNLRPRIVDLANKHRVPDFYWASEFVESGGLMSYGESLRASYRVAAGYIGKIKKGASPRDLPVEQPTRFELVINAKRAQSLGIVVPREMLLRADAVVQ